MRVLWHAWRWWIKSNMNTILMSRFSKQNHQHFSTADQNIQAVSFHLQSKTKTHTLSWLWRTRGHVFTLGGRWGLSDHMTTLPHLSDSNSLTLAHPNPAGSAWREEKRRVREGHRFMELSQGLSDRQGISFTREDRCEAAGWAWSSEGTDEEFNNVLIATTARWHWLIDTEAGEVGLSGQA